MTASANNRRREPGKAGNDKLLLGVALLALAVVGIVWVSVTVGSHLDSVNPGLTTDPFAIITGLFRGTVAWSPAATVTAATIGGVLLLLVGYVLWLRSLGRRNRSIVDWTARYMATPRELAGMQGKKARTKSARLGVPESYGVPIGRLVNGAQMLYASFEDMVLLLAGPRTGKSTSFVIPAIAAAPGAVVTTSNKGDVLEATRDLRTKAGPVWVFDPQQVAVEPASWWWNPLSYVTDDTKAARLAQHFASGTREAGSRTDSHFEPGGRELLAGLLLAAAIGGRPITDVYEWTTLPEDETAAKILADSDYPLMAKSLRGFVRLEHRERGSMYSTARGMAACLKNSGTIRWVNPAGSHDDRPQFNPHEFVRGTGTLYSLSKEGSGSAGPLVLALTAATVEAAEELAAASPGGRLPTPMLGILDEAANVCRWKDLPDLYSHYGSRGIPIMAAFQSWSQGVGVFGKEGMLKLWSAANVKLYAGGIGETEFLGMVSELIGTYDKETTSASMNKGIRSTTTALRRERIMEVSDLGALPTPRPGAKIGRTIMMASGSRAALVRTTPWFDGPKPLVAEITASIAAHQPGRRPPAPAAATVLVTGPELTGENE